MNLDSSIQKIGSEQSGIALKAQAVNPNAVGDTSGKDRLFAAAEPDPQLKERTQYFSCGPGHVPDPAQCAPSQRWADLRTKSLNEGCSA
jgi:hypothetical protein